MNQHLLNYLDEHYVVLQTMHGALWFNSGDLQEDRDGHDDNDILSAKETHEDMLFRMGEIDIDDWDEPAITDECVDGLWGFDILSKGIGIKDLNAFEEISIPHVFALRITDTASGFYKDNSWFYDIYSRFDKYCVVENSAAHWKVFVEKKNIPILQKEIALRLLKL